MIDLHSHILPGIDDGAKTAEDGRELLNQMDLQGVTVAVATPHFFPLSALLDDFLLTRDAALKELRAVLSSDFQLKIIPGAEVLYFGGIGKVEDVKALTLGNSRYLLLELLGLKKIDRQVLKDISDLKENLGLVPVIAHVERYCKYKGYKDLLRLIESGEALCQINATFMTSKSENRAVKEMLNRGIVHFVASDCHHPVRRPVRLREAFATLSEISPAETEKILRMSENLERELCDL